MPGRLKVVIALAGVALCTWLGWNSLRPRGVFERTYKGHTLGEWVAGWRVAGQQQDRDRYRLAISALCSNDLPALVTALDYDPGPREHKIESRLSWLPGPIYSELIIGPLADHREECAEIAGGALKALGPEAASMIRRLDNLTSSSNHTVAAMAFLLMPHLETNGIRIVLSGMDDESSNRRLDALNAFLLIRNDFGTNYDDAASPALARCLQSKDLRMVATAASLLGAMKIAPTTSVPALIAALPGSKPATRVSVMQALGNYGESAKAAVPELLRACEDSKAYVREAATNALFQIAPETFPNTPAPR